MVKVLIPHNVADAIEKVWDNRTSENVIKYLWLNNWDLLQNAHPTEYEILLAYAEVNPLNYMKALVDGYNIEFDKNMCFNNAGVESCFSDAIIDGNYTSNSPLQIKIGSAYENLSIGDAKSLSDNIIILIQELKKVRE